MRFTILGASGFIGGHLARHLVGRGWDVATPTRSELDDLDRTGLGHVVDAIGLTADFRGRPFDTVEAHVGRLARLLDGASFESWLYLSSTRVYSGSSNDEAASESTPLVVMPSRDSLYDLTKLTGEALCLGHEDTRVRIARLSNVYGHGMSPVTFLGSILTELAATGSATIGEAPSSAKDYVAVEDVVDLIERIAVDGRYRLYNVASGRQVTHGELADFLVRSTGGDVRFASDAPARSFPMIDIARVRGEFGVSPRSVLDEPAHSVNRWCSRIGDEEGSSVHD